MPEQELSERLEFAIHAAKHVGKLTLEFFSRHDLGVETKGDGTPVTQADRLAERAFRELVDAHYPADAVAGEEYGTRPGTSRCTWIVDPIDGTFSFIHGVPLFGTLIALEHAGQVTLGVVHMPAMNETAYAVRGGGAWLHTGSAKARRVSVSKTESLEEATVCTTSADYFRAANCLDALDELQRRVGHTRGWSDCYAALLLISGRVDAVIEPLIQRWDVAALHPILVEAGGQYSDWAGVDSIDSPNAVMSNGLIHDALLELLSTHLRVED
ncbi:MAG: hypothetical protein D6695_07130 [Planctomycetota bacterium]|nr:MAG: hypothetical protein D6695_07130 [Planctomycetota bacterium]